MDDSTAPAFRALADPSRRLLLDGLFERDGQTLGELTARLPDMTRFGVMKHLDVLEAAGLEPTARAEEIEKWILKAVPDFIQQIDVYGLLIANMRKLDEERLEKLIKNDTSNEQFNYIKDLGGILGFFGGLVIWQPVPALIVFGALGLSLWLLDVVLLRARKLRLPDANAHRHTLQGVRRYPGALHRHSGVHLLLLLSESFDDRPRERRRQAQLPCGRHPL
jgi:DNA-binding transcriptional ArsR family regulator